MNKLKQFLSVVLVIVMLFTLAPVSKIINPIKAEGYEVSTTAPTTTTPSKTDCSDGHSFVL